MSVDSCRPVLSVTDCGGTTVVSFSTRCNLTESNAHAAGTQLLELAGQPGRQQLVLDLGNVDFLTSTALGKLLALHKKLRTLDGRLVLANAGPLVREVFAVTHLDRVFEIRPDEESNKLSA
jgi:anti-sigma B factor antagonist